MCILFLPGGACAEIPLLRHPRPAGAQVEHWTFQDRELPYAKISIPVRSLSRLRCCIFWLFSRSTKILNFLIRPISACQVDEGMVALAADGFHSCQALYQQELQNLKRSITSRLIKLHFISWNRTKILFSIYLSLTFKQLGERDEAGRAGVRESDAAGLLVATCFHYVPLWAIRGSPCLWHEEHPGDRSRWPVRRRGIKGRVGEPCHADRKVLKLTSQHISCRSTMTIDVSIMHQGAFCTENAPTLVAIGLIARLQLVCVQLQLVRA